MARSCPSCTNDIEHCHGLLTVHLEGWVECSESVTCPGADPVLHDARAECDCPVIDVSVELVA